MSIHMNYKYTCDGCTDEFVIDRPTYLGDMLPQVDLPTGWGHYLGTILCRACNLALNRLLTRIIADFRPGMDMNNLRIPS